MSQFLVTVMREMDAQPMVPDASLVVTAVDEVAAAAMVFRSCGGGYADVIDVSPSDAVSVESETLYSFLREQVFCTARSVLGSLRMMFDCRTELLMVCHERLKRRRAYAEC